MKSSQPARMILPAIIAVSILVTALSAFSGSAYVHDRATHKQAQRSLYPNGGISDKSELNSQYPANIQKWKSLIEQSAAEHNIDPDLVAAVMLQESGGQEQVISSSGAVGLMQVMPRDGIAATFMCGSSPCFSNRPSSSKLLDPAFNVDYGTRMLVKLISSHEGSLREALYDYGPMDVGYAYADIVLAIYAQYQ